jgi:hypothetical protein
MWRVVLLSRVASGMVEVLPTMTLGTPLAAKGQWGAPPF